MAVDRHLLARLKKLLLARDVDLITQGVEFVTSLDDPELWDVLLAGVDYRPESVARPHPEGERQGEAQPNGSVEVVAPEWIRSPLFQGTAPAQPYHDLALTLLVANAPSAELRDRVDGLVVRSWDGGWPRTYFERMPLDGIERYPNLRKLTVQTAVTTDLAPIGLCPALETLRVEGGGRTALTGLGRCKSLTRLEIVAQLDSTAGIEGAPLDAIAIHSRCLRDLRGLGATPVRTIELHAGPNLDVSDLARAKRLTSLSADRFTTGLDLTPLRGAPALDRLELWSAVNHLPTMPALTTLFASELGRCEPQPALTSLALVATSALPPLTTAFPSLTSLWIRSSAVPSLAFLRGASSLRHLRLDAVQTDDATALGAIEGLEQLSLHRLSAPALDQLPAVPLFGPSGQTRHVLDLSGTPVRSVRGVASLIGIEIVDLHGCTSLETLDGLEATGVKVLDLRGCSALTDVTALAAMPELRMVATRGTPFHAGNLAGVQALISLAHDPDLEAARRKPAPKAATAKAARRTRIPVPEGQREVWERIQPLLAATTPSTVDALLDALTAHGTAEICDLLLAGVSRDGNRLKVRGRLLPMDKELRPTAAQRIAGLERGEASERLRAATTELSIDPRRHGRAPAAADLRGLRAFRALGVLAVTGRGTVGLEEIADHPALVELRAHGASLDALGPLPCAREIHDVHSGTTRVDFVRGAPQLVKLVEHPLVRLADLSGLRDHPSLAHLDVRSLATTADLSALPTLRALAHLELANGPVLPALDGLSALRFVKLVPSDAWRDLTCLEGLPAQALHLWFERPMSTVGLGRINKVQRLTLTGALPPLTELPPNLVRLELDTDASLDRLAELHLPELVLQRPADIGFVARIAGLRYLEVNAPHGALSLAPVAAAPSLDTFRFHPSASTSLEPLVGHPSLRLIQIPAWRSGLVQLPAGLSAAVQWT